MSVISERYAVIAPNGEIMSEFGSIPRIYSRKEAAEAAIEEKLRIAREELFIEEYQLPDYEIVYQTVEISDWRSESDPEVDIEYYRGEDY